MSIATIAENQQPHRIAAICPGCHTRWMVLPQLTGKKACCGKCKTQFVVPAPSQAMPQQHAMAVNKPVEKLFSSGQIGVATLLGSVLAGAIMMAMNFVRLGRHATATGTLVAGIASLGAVGAIGYLAASHGIPGNFIIPLLVAFATQAMAAEAFASQYAANEKLGVKPRSNWAAAGITVIVIALLVAVIMGAIISTQLV